MEKAYPIYESLERIMQFFEKNRFNLITGSFLILLYGIIRGYLEFSFFSRIPITGEIYMNIYNLLAQVIALYMAFIGGVLVITYFSKGKPRDIANAVLIGMVILVLGPLLDRYLLGRSTGYEFVWAGELEGMGWGILTQLFLIVLLGAVYVAVKAESIKLGIYTFISLVLLLVGAGFVPYIIFRGFWVFFSRDATQVISALASLLVILMCAVLIIKLSNKKLLDSLISNARYHRSLFFIAVSLVGVVLAGNMLLDYGEDAVLTIEVDDIPFVALVVIAVAFASQFSFLVQDVHSENSSGEKNPMALGILSKRQYLHLAVLMALISLPFVISLGIVPVILMLVFFAIAWSHGAVLSGTRYTFIGPLFLGLESLTVFFIGYFSSRSKELIAIGEFLLDYPTLNDYNVSFTAISIGALAFAAGAILLGRYNPLLKAR